MDILSLYYRQVTEIYSDAAASDLSYISGVVSLGEGIAESTFSVQTIDDSISEFSEDFQVYLVAVSGKASISDDVNTVELTGKYVVMETTCTYTCILQFSRVISVTVCLVSPPHLCCQ